MSDQNLTEANSLPDPFELMLDAEIEEAELTVTQRVMVNDEETAGGISYQEQGVDKCVDERLLKLVEADINIIIDREEEGAHQEDEIPESKMVGLGPKCFLSSLEMFDYFYNFVHHWPLNTDINKFEHMVLLDLLKIGHPEFERKIGIGIQAFQVRTHPKWKSRCFFLIRNDESIDDFSFRKCVDHILPLPEEMQMTGAIKSNGHGGKGVCHTGHGGKKHGGGSRRSGRGYAI